MKTFFYKKKSIKLKIIDHTTNKEGVFELAPRNSLTSALTLWGRDKKLMRRSCSYKRWKTITRNGKQISPYYKPDNGDTIVIDRFNTEDYIPGFLNKGREGYIHNSFYLCKK